MKKTGCSYPDNQRGAIHVLMCFMIVPLLAVAAVAVDGFLIMTSGIQQDNNAEYAALAALKEFRNSPIHQDRFDKAARRAESISGLNFYVGAPGAAQMQEGGLDGERGNISFGHIRADGKFAAGPMMNAVNQPVMDHHGMPVFNAISVELHTAGDSGIIARFSRIFGLTRVNVASTVTAWFDADGGQYRILR